MNTTEITGLIVAATSVVSIIFNIFYMNLTRKTILEAKEQRLNSIKPSLLIRATATMTSSGITEWNISVRNPGKGLANNIRVSMKIGEEWEVLDLPLLLAPQEHAGIVKKLPTNEEYPMHVYCEDDYGRTFSVSNMLMPANSGKEYQLVLK